MKRNIILLSLLLHFCISIPSSEREARYNYNNSFIPERPSAHIPPNSKFRNNDFDYSSCDPSDSSSFPDMSMHGFDMHISLHPPALFIGGKAKSSHRTGAHYHEGVEFNHYTEFIMELLQEGYYVSVADIVIYYSEEEDRVEGLEVEYVIKERSVEDIALETAKEQRRERTRGGKFKRREKPTKAELEKEKKLEEEWEEAKEKEEQVRKEGGGPEREVWQRREKMSSGKEVEEDGVRLIIQEGDFISQVYGSYDGTRIRSLDIECKSGDGVSVGFETAQVFKLTVPRTRRVVAFAGEIGPTDQGLANIGVYHIK
jgi:hypothetical protein